MLHTNLKVIHFRAEYLVSEEYCENLESSDVVENCTKNSNKHNLEQCNVAVHVLRGEMGSRRLIFNGLTTEAEYIKQETSEVSIQL